MVSSPEFIVLGVNLGLIFMTYIVIYPKFVGSSYNKLVINDLVASLISLLISGYLFWGKGIDFNAVLFTANWFWFSILTYFLIELPFVTRYMKKYAVNIE
jgi:hypothetical protein